MSTCHSLGSAPGSSPPAATLTAEDALQCFHVVPLPAKLNVTSKRRAVVMLVMLHFHIEKAA